MKRFTRPAVLCLAVAIAVFAAACPKRTTIGEIEANPQKYNDKTVAIAGVVKTSYGVSIPIVSEGGGIYKVDDGTGTIWVITRKGVPTRDTQLGIKGKIQNGVTYNGRNYGLVLIEDDRKFKKS